MTAAKKKRKPGRPPKMRDGRRINLYLPQAAIVGLHKMGDGNVSLGVQRALEYALKWLELQEDMTPKGWTNRKGMGE